MSVARKPRTFTPGQIETFLSIADTLIPALTPQQLTEFQAVLSTELPARTEEEWGALLEFAQTPASTAPGFMDAVKTMERNMSAAQLKAVAGLMDLLRSRVGSLIFCRSWTPFHLLSPADRTQTVQMWRTSSIRTYHSVFRAVAGLARYCYAQTSTIYQGIGIPPVDPEADSPRYTEREAGFHRFAFEDLSRADAVLAADVVVVGTGAGGGVAAKNVSEWAQDRGVSVLVLEQGGYVPHEELKFTETECMQRMWERAVLTTNVEGSLTTGYARTFGGGTAINWGVSLRTPGMVRKEWADLEEGAGIEWFVSRAYQESLERVERRMGVSTKNYEHNKPNTLMLEACDKLGYKIEEAPVNSGGHKHNCSYCGHGCRYGEKMGSMNSWLVDASNASCRFAQQVSVRRVLFEDIEGDKRGRRRVVGVEAVVEGGRTVVIKCKKVIVSGGTMQSPVLLLRSGLKNPQIGANLRLHPVTWVYGFFSPNHPSTPINPTHGAVITTVITEATTLSPPPHTHYGARIEAGYAFPVVGLPQLPWLDAASFKRYLANHRNMVALFSLARDGRPCAPTPDDPSPPPPTPGRIRLGPDPFGEPLFSYTPTKEDTASLVEGLVVAAEVLRTAGASEILAAVRGMQPYVLPPAPATGPNPDSDPGVLAPGFREWLAELRRLGALQDDRLSLSSAHQMGTNRMGAVPWEDADADGLGYVLGPAAGGKRKWWEKGGVVDPEGRVYGVEGLVVADGSVLPGATGVNPMVSIMAVADLVSRRWVARWEGEGLGRGEEKAGA